MNTPIRPMIVAICLATLQMSGAARAADTATAAGTTPPSTAAHQQAGARSDTPPAKPLLDQRPTTDWISVEDTTFTPVADDVSRHLLAAGQAFDAKDNAKAAAELKAVSADLQGQIKQLTRKGEAQGPGSARLRTAVAAVDKAATDVGAGRLHTRAEFDRAFDKAFMADLDSRWIETDTTTWYPIVEEPQQHFSAAIAALAKKDDAAAAREIRKANAFIRLEAARATAGARTRLDQTVLDLDTLADSVAKGGVKDAGQVNQAFARAETALALSHRAKATESWTARQYHKAGYELKAAAHGLETAAGWAGDTVAAGARHTVTDTRALGDRLASGASWSKDEINKGFAHFDHALDDLAHKLGVGTDRTPAAAGAGSSTTSAASTTAPAK